MEGMKAFPDNYFDLAIVDPPYGIGDWTSDLSVYTLKDGSKKRVKRNNHKKITWNNNIPNGKYFDELLRVSKHQITWGANYYNCFSLSGGAIIWYKGKCNPVYSACEIASISSQKKVDYVQIDWQSGFCRQQKENVIHKCQKPIQLYKWILNNYAKPDFKIIDTHAGSCSSVIAFLDYDCDWIAFEIDKDYYEAASKRIEIHKQQLKLF